MIEKRVREIAWRFVTDKKYVCPVDILIGLGWLNTADLARWRKRQVPYLEAVVQANLGKLTFAMKEFRRWALAPHTLCFLRALEKEAREP
jgi:hypothetical protein